MGKPLDYNLLLSILLRFFFFNVVNDTNTYRDILVFVNGNIQGTANSLVNVNINEGDNLTIIARAVGEVTAVEVAYANSTGFELAANETNFSCNTGFPCGTEYSDDNLDNRYQLCTLTNAAAVTDNQTLRFVVQYNETGQNIITELGEVNVTGKVDVMSEVYLLCVFLLTLHVQPY